MNWTSIRGADVIHVRNVEHLLGDRAVFVIFAYERKSKLPSSTGEDRFHTNGTLRTDIAECCSLNMVSMSHETGREVDTCGLT